VAVDGGHVLLEVLVHVLEDQVQLILRMDRLQQATRRVREGRERGREDLTIFGCCKCFSTAISLSEVEEIPSSEMLCFIFWEIGGSEDRHWEGGRLLSPSEQPACL
jgi:hypothetical protein